jgi:hypothetical protein
MVWCPDIVEIVRRTARELFHHESTIGNFSGKYLVMTNETRVFAWNYRRMLRQNTMAGRLPGHRTPIPARVDESDFLPKG